MLELKLRSGHTVRDRRPAPERLVGKRQHQQHTDVHRAHLSTEKQLQTDCEIHPRKTDEATETDLGETDGKGGTECVSDERRDRGRRLLPSAGLIDVQLTWEHLETHSVLLIMKRCFSSLAC